MSRNDRLNYQHPIPSSIKINCNPSALPTAIAIANFSNISWTVATNPDGSGIIGFVPSYAPQTFTLNQPYAIYLIGSGSSVAGDFLNLEWGPDPLGNLPASYGLAGNEFFRKLQIGPTGGIYQGTGTFDAPITGLKLWATPAGIGQIGFFSAGNQIWGSQSNGDWFFNSLGGITWDATGIVNDTRSVSIDGTGIFIGVGGVTYDSTGITNTSGSVAIDGNGLRTYNGTTLECSVGTDGVLTAGAGAVTLSSTGIDIIVTGILTPTSGNAYSFLSSSADHGGLFAWVNGGYNHVGVEAYLTGIANAAEVDIEANGATGKGLVSIIAFDNTNGSTEIDLHSDTKIIDFTTASSLKMEMNAFGITATSGFRVNASFTGDPYNTPGVYIERYGLGSNFIWATKGGTGVGDDYMGIQGTPLALCDDSRNGGVTVGSTGIDPGYGGLVTLKNVKVGSSLSNAATLAACPTLQLGNAGGSGFLGQVIFGDANHAIYVDGDNVTISTFGGKLFLHNSNTGNTITVATA